MKKNIPALVATISLFLIPVGCVSVDDEPEATVPVETSRTTTTTYPSTTVYPSTGVVTEEKTTRTVR